VRWTTAIGYPVKQDYRKYRSRSIKTKIGDTVRQHKIREETDKIDGRKMVNGLAPNWVHSTDAALMFKTILEAKRCGVTSFAVVHDSFATVAADAEALSLSIRHAAADIFSRDLLAEFKAEVEAFLPPDVSLPEIPTYGDLDPACVRDSLYFFN
jgi:DNA-directed RNA polymerase